MTHFTAEEFDYPVREVKLGKPESDEWKLFVDKNGIKVYAWLDKETGLFQWKVFGEIEFPPAVVKKTLMDIEYRKKWDAYVSKIEMLESNNNADIIYWDVKYGIPMVSNRDYIYCREFKEVCENDEDYIVILSKTYENGKELVPVHKSKVRVEGFKQFMVLKKTASGTMLYMHSIDRPGGKIPSSLINWAAKSGIPNYLGVVAKACSNCPE